MRRAHPEVSTSCPCVCTADVAFVEDYLGHANRQKPSSLCAPRPPPVVRKHAIYVRTTRPSINLLSLLF
jgi:hypothetical protein